MTKLEHDALAIKAPGRRAEVQVDLNGKRELLELVLDRLDDFRHVRTMAISGGTTLTDPQMATSEDEDDDDASSDGEDILSEVIPTPSDSMADSVSTDLPTESSGQDDKAEAEPSEFLPPTVAKFVPPAMAPTPSPEPPSEMPTPSIQDSTATTQTIRPRNTAAAATSSSSQSAHSTARAALFSNRTKSPANQTTASTATAEALLDRQRAEQDALSNSILHMAGALKESSQRFSSTLEADKDVVGRAAEGMDKTEQGMEATKGRMGALKRVTEGKGWWGRMILYAWVYGLMVGLVLLVFVMPKLRF